MCGMCALLEPASEHISQLRSLLLAHASCATHAHFLNTCAAKPPRAQRRQRSVLVMTRACCLLVTPGLVLVLVMPHGHAMCMLLAGDAWDALAHTSTHKSPACEPCRLGATHAHSSFVRMPPATRCSSTPPQQEALLCYTLRSTPSSRANI
mmetsp:Transcript_6437/g.17201  ORF Transcript_6437/g.17201 Transcript_6437/m.17201 type:complete len:151 (-) Transcript_6437:66-518(-)